MTLIVFGLSTDSLVEQLTNALDACDVSVTSGGVSMGEKVLLGIFSFLPSCDIQRLLISIIAYRRVLHTHHARFCVFEMSLNYWRVPLGFTEGCAACGFQGQTALRSSVHETRVTQLLPHSINLPAPPAPSYLTL